MGNIQITQEEKTRRMDLVWQTIFPVIHWYAENRLGDTGIRARAAVEKAGKILEFGDPKFAGFDLPVYKKGKVLIDD